MNSPRHPSIPLSRVAGLTTSFFVILITVSTALAASRPVLKTIAIDGNASDWSDVVSNDFQTTIDGNGILEPCSGIDLDCPIQSTGRDLGKFAWTYDSANLYLYLERLGSDANTQSFYFYMDLDRDRLMESSDFVLKVDYKGSNRSTKRELNRYSACANVPPAYNSNRLVDSSDIADGWTICGSLGTPAQSYPDVDGGFASGEGFEVTVAWADLGFAEPAPIFFHVASGNGNNVPGQIDDNCGGPNDGIGTFGFFAADLLPNRTGSRTPGSTITYVHTVTNIGTFDDAFSLSAISSQGFSFQLTDTSGNPITSTPTLTTLAGSNSYTFHIVISIPPGASVGTIDVTTVKATSQGDPLSFDTVTDTTAVGQVTVTQTASATVAPGDFVDYTHTITNDVLSDDVDLVQTSPNGWRVDYLDGGVVFATDLDGDGDFTEPGDLVAAGYDANGNGLPDLQVSSGSSRPFTTRITATSGSPIITEVEPIQATSPANAVVAGSSNTTTLRPAVELTPDHLSPSNLYGGGGMTVGFAHVLRNNRSFASLFDLAGPNPAGWLVEIWSDPDGDGDPSDGAVVTSSPSVAGNGGEFRLVVLVSVPAIPIVGSAITTATATGPAGSASAGDELQISQIATFKNSSYSLPGAHFPKCATLFAKGFTLAPGNTYTIEVRNPSGVLVQTRDQVANVSGETFDSYIADSADPTGDWSVTLKQGSTTLNTATCIVELSGLVSPVATGRVSYPANGSTVSFSASYLNSASQSAYSGTTLRLVIRDLTTSQYLTTAGTFAPVVTGDEDTNQNTNVSVPNGNSVSFASSAANVAFPVSPAVYRLTARWDNSCGGTIASGIYDFLVGPVLETHQSLSPDVPRSVFVLGDTVFGAGNVYAGGQAYRVGIYDAAGDLVSSVVSSAADGVGRISSSWLASASANFGTGWHLASYSLTSTLPLAFPSDTPINSDPDRYASVSFELWRGVTAAPVVDPTIDPAATSVSGTSTEPAGTAVSLYVNGVFVGATTTQSGGSWSLAGIGPLTAGDVVKARAQKTEFLMSVDSNLVPVTVRLLRAAMTSLTPPSPSYATIFPFTPGGYSMDPASRSVQSPFASAGSWPNEASDLVSIEPLIFYEVNFDANTLRVSKSGGAIVVAY